MIPLASSVRPAAELTHRDRRTFDRDRAAKRAPAVLRGAAAAWPAVREWSFESFAKRFGHHTVSVEVGELFAHTDVDDRGRLVRGTRLELTLADFIQAITRTPNPAPLYLSEWRIFDVLPELAGDVAGPGADLFDRPLHAPMKAYLGTAGAFTPLHFDYAPNLTVQIMGRKRWVFHRPRRRVDILAYPRFSAMGHFSEINNRERTELFEAERDASRFESFVADVGPGDAVYVPPYWWHHVETLEPSISLHFFWKPARLIVKQLIPSLVFRLKGVRFGSDVVLRRSNA